MKKLSTLVLSAIAPIIMWAAGWPANYGGVMLQGFYWDSYGITWNVLNDRADELSNVFDLIWVPNSASIEKSGTARTMGYAPVYWLTHNSCFGSEADLRRMIATYKSKNTGIIEDLVINHKNGASSWTDFPDESVTGKNTGKKYTVKWDRANNSQICSTDECVAAGYKATGAPDEGEDFNGSRDLDHTNATTQANVITYMDFLKNDLGYAGFRLDMTKGYSGYYTGVYNNQIKPTYCVGEYYDGNADLLRKWLDDTHQWNSSINEIQSATFDFALKFKLNDACNGTWSALNDKGLCADVRYNRYAVTFVDNHDTGRDGYQKINSSNLVAANAAILALPGTPCIYYPHYQSNKAAITNMIKGRRAAGVHNQSPITTQQESNGGYIIETQGTKGKVYVQLGGATNNGTPSGFQLVQSGTNYKFYVSNGLNWQNASRNGGDTPVEDETKDIYVMGEVNGNTWAPNVGAKMTTTDNNTYTIDVTTEGENDGYSYFSFTHKLATSAGEDAWASIDFYRFGANSDKDYPITSSMMGQRITLGEQGTSTAFKIAKGEYKFTINKSARTLIVTGHGEDPGPGPDPEPTSSIYVLGETTGKNWAPNDGVALGSTDNNIYKGTVSFDGRHDENGEMVNYFGLTTKLGATADDWATCNANRLFAPADPGTNFWVTEEQLGNTISLTGTDPDVAFRIPAGSYDLEVNLSAKTLVITRSGDTPGPGPDPQPGDGVFIMGEVGSNGWAANVGVAMTAGADGIYTAAVSFDGRNVEDVNGETQNVNYFGFTTKLGASADDWDAIAGNRLYAPADPGTNFWVTEEQLGNTITLNGTDPNVAFRIPAGTYSITLNLNAKTVVITRGDGPVPVSSSVYILGEVNGNGWSPYQGLPMNGSGTTYTANVTTSRENNYFSFTKKLASGTAEPGTEVWNAAWDEILPYRFGAEEGEGDCDVVVGQAMPLGAEGTARAYKIGAGNWTFTLDLAARTFTVTQQGDTPTPQPGDDYFVMGEVNGNGWFPNVGEKMVGKGNNIYTLDATTDGSSNGFNYFSFTKKLYPSPIEYDETNPGPWEEAWASIADYRFGAEGVEDYPVVENQAMPLGLDGTSTAFKIGAGEWTFTLNMNNRTLTVTKKGDTPGPQPTFDPIYIMGEVNGNGWFPYQGFQMSTDDGKNYTAAVTTDGASGGFSYFSFTKKLYPSPIEYDETNPGPWEEAWASIADYRFGAEGVEDYPVVENQAMPLGLDGTSTAFKIGAGEWTFTLNMTARTLTVTKGQPAGYNFDVNGDGQVTATDIACIVNVLAGLEPASKYNGRTDVNKDGNTTATDISMIVNHLAGL